MGRQALIILLAAIMSVGTAEPSAAQGKGGGKSGKPAPAQSQENYEQLGQVPVGLLAVFPTGARCSEVASPFGSPVRFDGSPRVNDHFGFHNGMDIAAKEGTPLLSIAGGDVIHSGEGGLLVGNYVWLRYAPNDTGLPVYLFARYQHLDKPSPLKIGARVTLGEIVGPVGKTGTIGPYFGPAGFSHLHLLVFAGDGPDFTIRDAVVEANVNRRYLDPLAVFMKPTTSFDNHVLSTLPDSEKRIAIPYQTADGRREPADTKMVWPIACARS